MISILQSYCLYLNSFVCCLVAKLCPTLWDPMDCSKPDFCVPHRLPEFAQVHAHCIGDVIQISHLLSPSYSAFNLSQPHSFFLMNWLFASGDQNIGASASALILPKSIQGWFPLRLVLSPCCSRNSQVFSSTTVQKHQFFGALPCLWSSSHNPIQLLEKP